MIKALAAFGAFLCVSGCVTAGREGPPQGDLLREARVEGYGPDIRSSDPDQTAFVDWLQDHVGDARASSPDGSLNILALSGGGAGGVFGAGALKGLTLSGARPTFQIVTGVSTGALIAPFAFLGPEWDDELEAAYTGGASAELLDSVGLFSLFRVGIVNDANLRKLVSDYISPELVAAVAAESAKGRILLVATTNLDAEAPVFWDMGAIARQGGEDARRMFIDVLVASSSVPGAFPPVMIPVRDSSGAHDEMHVDGGVTVPFFLFPEVAFISDEKFEQLNGAHLCDRERPARSGAALLAGQYDRDHAARLERGADADDADGIAAGRELRAAAGHHAALHEHPRQLSVLRSVRFRNGADAQIVRLRHAMRPERPALAVQPGRA